MVFPFFFDCCCRDRFNFGECFFALPKDEAESLIEEKLTAMRAKNDNLQMTLESTDDEMKNLKVRLYAKFGDNIYLEEE